MAQQTTQEQGNTLKAINMYTWRLNRSEAEKRAVTVNRELMRRQHLAS